MKSEWFAGWFDSPYYHLLYNHRDDTEAERFIANLCNRLEIRPGARVWDIACGKGRHSLAFARRGFLVTGTDLSSNSIREAKTNSQHGTEFEVHDMREPYRENYFDVAVNLFTSIGYFSDFNDNYSVFRNVVAALKPGGKFVIDFLNAEKVRALPPGQKTERRGEIEFSIRKSIEENQVVKTILFSTDGHQYEYQERVTLLTKDDFLKFAASAQLTPVATYGNYDLDAFDAGHSDRLILIFEKKEN